LPGTGSFIGEFLVLTGLFQTSTFVAGHLHDQASMFNILNACSVHSLSIYMCNWLPSPQECLQMPSIHWIKGNARTRVSARLHGMSCVLVQHICLCLHMLALSECILVHTACLCCLHRHQSQICAGNTFFHASDVTWTDAHTITSVTNMNAAEDVQIQTVPQERMFSHRHMKQLLCFQTRTLMKGLNACHIKDCLAMEDM